MAPFPALHARANQLAAEKAERAKAVRDRAEELLEEIEPLLATAAKD
jgi:hypothetical protein